MTDATIESVKLQTAQMPINVDAETATYVGMLEGTIAALCINDVKNRTLLELLTGDGWEAAKVDFNGDALVGLAVSSLVKQTGMSIFDAKVLVTKRWEERNHPADYVIPQAVPAEDYVAEKSPPLMSARLAAWKERQLKEAAELPSATKDLDTKPD